MFPRCFGASLDRWSAARSERFEVVLDDIERGDPSLADLPCFEAFLDGELAQIICIVAELFGDVGQGAEAVGIDGFCHV